MVRLLVHMAKENSIKIHAKIYGPHIKRVGRWSIIETERQKEIKSIWANSDNCGAEICGQPECIKEIAGIKK